MLCVYGRNKDLKNKEETDDQTSDITNNNNNSQYENGNYDPANITWRLGVTIEQQHATINPSTHSTY